MRVDPLAGRNDEAEETVLGCMLRLNDVIPEVALILRKEDFGFGPHALAYDAILAMSARGDPVDIHLLGEELQRRGQLADVFGDDPANDIRDRWMAAVGTGHNARHYAKLVRNRALLRSLARAGAAIHEMGVRPTGRAEEMLGRAEDELAAIRERRPGKGPVPLSDVARRWEAQLEAKSAARAAGKPLGVVPSVPGLASIVPAFFPGEMVVLAGRPGTGKTAVALAILRGALDAGENVLFCSLEMPDTQLFERMVAAESMVPACRLRTAEFVRDDYADALLAAGRLASRNLFIDDSAHQSVSRIANAARQFAAKRPLGLLVIDYAGLVEPEDRKQQRNEQVSLVSRRCKATAKDLAIPLVLLVQVNRASEARGDRRPRLADLRESGSLEQDCDTALLLHRPDDRDDLLEVHVAKQRSGATGEVAVMFRRHLMTFEPVAEPGTRDLRDRRPVPRPDDDTPFD